MSQGGSDASAKVLVVCAVNGHGGPIQSIVTVLNEVSGSWNVTVASQLGSVGEPTALEAAAGGSIAIVRPRGFALIQAQLQLLRGYWRDRGGFAAIHANGLTEVVVVLPLAILTRLPVTVWVHNWEKPRPFRILEPVVKVLGRQWAWTAVSQLAAGLVPWTNAAIVPNPVAVEFVPVERSHDGPLQVAFLAGSDRPSKGFDLLPSIIRNTNREDIQWTLYTSPAFSADDPRCRRAWSQLLSDLSERVDIRGRTTDVPGALASADVVIAPSRNESFNRVIAEAIATATPFVASDIAPHRELVALSGAGRLFSLGSPDSAAALLNELCRDSEQLQRMVEQAKANSRAFVPSRVAAQLETVWGNHK